MKKLALLIVTAFLFTNAYSQCDNAYFPFEEGVSYEMTSYTKNDKEDGKVRSTIKDGAIDGNSITISNQTYDKKGELLSEGDFVVICDNGTIKIDMEQYMPDELLEQYENMDVTIEGDFVEIPNDLSAGQMLPDGSGVITIKMAQGAMNMNMTMNMKFTDRKVEKKETITTSAGSFEAYKVTETTITSMKMMGMNQETTNTSSKWYTKGVGIVKTETYDKKGELMYYSLLTDFSK
ncbi:hypothetical protein [Marinoscillum sp. MHG1-6]|uniref:TapB family protein n=1 Tax=Marinoscillum sp. MHG1-6 TaxID=2959627 RepID=UPI0021580723|nr:hypothetical protein [Marinoscillum sp. MHG1-6]